MKAIPISVIALFICGTAFCGPVTLRNGKLTLQSGILTIQTDRAASAAAACSPAPIFVSSATHYFGNQSSTNITIVGVTAGDYIQVGVIANLNNAGSITVSDDATPTSTYSAHSKIVNSAGPTTVQVFTATANATGNLKITINLPAAADCGAHVVAARNILSPGGFDTQATGTESGSGTTFNTGNFTTANANNFIFVVLGNETGGISNITLTSSAATLTKINDELGNVSSSAYGITTATQTTKNATATWTGASTDGAMIVTVAKGSCAL